MECAFPTTNENNEQIDTILKTSKNIAIIGLSPNSEKPSYMVAKYLIEHGYKIFPIYPKGEEILGQKVYRSLAEIPEPIDIVDVFRKPDAIPAVLEEVLKVKGIKTLWLQLGIVNNEAAERAKNAGLNVVQNRCTKIEHARMNLQ